MSAALSESRVFGYKKEKSRARMQKVYQSRLRQGPRNNSHCNFQLNAVNINIYTITKSVSSGSGDGKTEKLPDTLWVCEH